MNKPKILAYDLETLPIPRAVYQRIPSFGAWPGRGFAADIQVIMSVSYKWLHAKGAPKVISGWDFKREWAKDRFNDAALVKEFRKVIAEADGVITHNGISFDECFLQTRLSHHRARATTKKARNEFGALPKIKHVDTKRVAKSKLKLYSNALDAVAEHLNCTPKEKPSGNKWDIWTRIAFGEATKADYAWMEKYNKQDVGTLIEVFMHLRPHARHIPNYNTFLNLDKPFEFVCPSCSSEDITKNGTRPHLTTTRLYQRWYCKDCGSHFRTDAKGAKPRVFV